MNFSFALSAVAISAFVALLKVTCVLAAALGVTALMRRQSAAARHLVWLVAMIATLVLPLWSAWSPVPLRILPPPAARPALVTSEPAGAPAPAVSHVASAPNAPPQVPEAPPARTGRPVGIGSLLLALWSLGAVVLLGRLALGAWVVRRVVREARVLEQPDWQRPLYEVADRLGLDDAPCLAQSSRIRMPFATGFLRAVIVLPAESTAWSADRRCAVLIHELAHVKRRDLVGHVVSRIACALYWFHPLVWTAARHLRAESERACDDLALVLGTGAGDYAEHLLDIVTAVRDERMPAVALAMAKPNEFEGRMLAILDPGRPRTSPGRAQAAWLIGALAGFALLVGGVSPAPRAMATPPSAGPAAAGGTLAAAPGSAERMASSPKKAAPKPAATAKPKPASEPRTPSTDEDSRDPSPDDEERQGANEAQRAQILARTLRTDSDPGVRRVAAWGLSNYADHDVAAKALAEAAAQEADEGVREMATWALAGSSSPAAITAIDAAFRRDKSLRVRRTAAWAAGEIGSPSFIDGLTVLLGDADPEMREVAAWSIGNCSPSKAPAALIRALGDTDRDVRLSVTWALYEIGDASAAEELEAAFRREKAPDVQRGLIRALGSMGDRAVPTLTRLVDSPDPEVRAIAIAALAGGHAVAPWPWPRPEPRPFP